VVTRRSLVVAVAAALLAGCSKGSTVDTGTTVGTEPTPIATASPRADPTETPTPQQTFKMGDVVRTKLGNKVVVYDWNTDVNWPINAKGGDVYSQIEVK
jgi:hypothetical protein